MGRSLSWVDNRRRGVPSVRNDPLDLDRVMSNIEDGQMPDVNSASATHAYYGMPIRSGVEDGQMPNVNSASATHAYLLCQ
jgi:hypothetical protein